MKIARSDNPPDAGLSRAFWSVGICGCLVSLGSFFVFDVLVDSVSVFVGAATALLNFWMTAYLVRGFLAPAGIRLPWALIATVKLVGVLGVLYWLLQRELLSLLPLVLGFAALPLGIVFGQTRPRALGRGEELSDA
jgi:hypothetical protein